MTCIKIPNGFLCVGTEPIKLGKYCFEMHPYCGPMRLKQDGEPSVQDFGKDFWPLFEKWQAERINEVM